MPIFSTFNTLLQISAKAFSGVVLGAINNSVNSGLEVSGAGKARRFTLPLGVRGNFSRNTKFPGTI